MPSENNNEQKDARTEFLKKTEMNATIDDKDNAGDGSFTPIYLNSDTTLQTPSEKKHDESIDPQKNDKVESIDVDAEETTFDKLNNEERDSSGGY